jgi:protein arginine N-methyltransferase 2
MSTPNGDAPARAAPSAPDGLPEELLTLADALLAAAKRAPASYISALLDRGAPAWYQDDDLGWSALHYAAERREPALISLLLRGGAVWNAVDRWGRTAGEVALSLGDDESWRLIRNEGVRSEMLHHVMAGAGEGITLRAEDKTSAGDNLEFLASKLTWDYGEDGRERVLDADGNG